MPLIGILMYDFILYPQQDGQILRLGRLGPYRALAHEEHFVRLTAVP